MWLHTEDQGSNIWVIFSYFLRYDSRKLALDQQGLESTFPYRMLKITSGGLAHQTTTKAPALHFLWKKKLKSVEQWPETWISREF